MLTVALAGWSQPGQTQMSSTWDESTGTLTINYQGGKIKAKDLNDQVGGPAEGREGNVQKLVLEGVWATDDINNDDFQKFINEKCLGNKPNQTGRESLYLDLSGCTNLKCKMTGIDDNGTRFTFEPTSGTSQVTYNYIYKKKTTYKYTYWGDNVVNIPDEDDHDWVGYINPFNNDPNMTAVVRWVDGQWVILDPWGGNNNIVLDKTPTTTWYDITDGEPGVEIVEYVNESELTATEDPEIFIKSVTETIQTSAFSLTKINSLINGITFPANDDFTLVPEEIFKECTLLETVVFPNNIVAIERSAFKGCTALENITWSTGLQYIGLDINVDKDNGCFQGCTSLETVDLSGCTSLEVLGRAAFNGTTALQTLSLPSSLEVIGGEAFHGSGLPSVDLSGCTSLEALRFECFEDCASLESVTLPSGGTLTFLGNDAFHSCTSLGAIDMSECTGITEFQSYDGKYKTFNNCTSLKTVILPPNLTEVPDDTGDGVFKGTGAIETLVFTGTPVYNGCELQNPCNIGKNAFAFNTKLDSVTLSKNIQFIDFQAFHSAAITKISIPASVDSLATHCFYGCTKLTTVIFEEFDKQYGTCDGAETKVAGAQGSGGQGMGAFEECQAITDVYINTMAELQCDNNAFDQDISWGAGDAGANFATLHFPKEKTEHYANLSHYLTDEIVTNPGLFHSWLEDHYDQAINPHKNGWYEFINSGPSVPEDGPEYQSIILRTFSDYDYAYLVPSGLRAYVVNKVEPNDDGNFEVTLQRLNVIPKRTGVIIYGHPNGKTQGGKPALVLTPVKFLETGDPLYDQKYNDAGELIDCDIEYNDDGTMVVQDTYRGPDQGSSLCRDNWGLLDESHAMYKNYLEPILSADGSTVAIKPYETVKVNGVKKTTFRNFALGRYTSTDYFSKDESTLNDETNYVGFFRMKNQKYKSGYAYLRLTGDVDAEGNALENPEFAVSDGGEILVKPDEPAVDKTHNIYPYYWEVMIKDGEPYDARAKMGDEVYNPKGWWNDKATPVAFDWREYTLSWGDRSEALVNPSGSAKYYGELEENADGIVKLVIPAGNEDGEFYTLQGVRVSNPTKGVYIQNGKKVIVK